MSEQRSFILTPNPAMRWHHLLLVYFVITFITLLIGVIFFMMGYTLILPFCGLDVIGLGAALYVSAHKSKLREVVTLSENKIAVESGYEYPERMQEFTGPWTKVILQKNNSRWLPSQLLIRSEGKQLEIGHFLNETERIELANELKKAISRFV